MARSRAGVFPMDLLMVATLCVAVAAGRELISVGVVDKEVLNELTLLNYCSLDAQLLVRRVVGQAEGLLLQVASGNVGTLGPITVPLLPGQSNTVPVELSLLRGSETVATTVLDLVLDRSNVVNGVPPLGVQLVETVETVENAEQQVVHATAFGTASSVLQNLPIPAGV